MSSFASYFHQNNLIFLCRHYDLYSAILLDISSYRFFSFSYLLSSHHIHYFTNHLFSQYLSEILELGKQYQEHFVKGQISGRKFICLDEKKLVSLGITHSAHRAKILAHSLKLFKCVLGRALVHRPLHPIDWCVRTARMGLLMCLPMFPFLL